MLQPNLTHTTPNALVIAGHQKHYLSEAWVADYLSDSLQLDRDVRVTQRLHDVQ